MISLFVIHIWTDVFAMFPKYSRILLGIHNHYTYIDIVSKQSQCVVVTTIEFVCRGPYCMPIIKV